MATISSLVSKVRIELGDLGKSFVTQFVADGTTNRFKLHYFPLDGNGVTVFRNGVDVSNSCSVEEQTGVLVTDDLPADGEDFTVSGNYYRYFTAQELESLVTTAVEQHSANHADALGRKITVANLPSIEEYPVTVYATTLALYTLATDAAFDIDIQAPDGVSIPRAERYRQLMEMIQTRETQYRELCVMLGIGMYKIDVLTLNRVSKMTNRLIPIYRPQEVDDRSYPQRVHTPKSTYGDVTPDWPTYTKDFTAYQGRAWADTLSFTGDFTGKSFLANLLVQRGSNYVVQHLALEVNTTDNTNFTADISLSSDKTLRLAERTYWSFSTVDDVTGEQVELQGGNFYTQRLSEVVL